MDSDSSIDEDRNRWSKQDMVPHRPNMNEQENSDVSDEENISRAARSIESPPESPQGGTHFESPPASPDPENKPGTPSPIQSPDDSASYESPLRSPDSQSDSRQLKNASPPRSLDLFLPMRLLSPVRYANRSPPSDQRKRSPATNYCRSPSPIRSPMSNHSMTNESPNSGPSRLRESQSNYPRSPSPVNSPNAHHSFRNRSPNSIQSPEKSPPHSPRSPNSIQSPASASHYGIQSPQRTQSPTNYIRSPSPYRSRSRNQSESPSHRAGRQNSESPGRSNSPLQQESSPRRFKGRRSPSQSPESTRRSPPLQRPRRDSNSDDGRSNISSASSFSSPAQSPPRPRTPPAQQSAPLRVKTVAELKSHAEDLSDVSDLDSMNSMSDDETEKPKPKENGEFRGSADKKTDVVSLRNTSTTGGLEGDDTEQLDFEADEKEEGECEVQPTTTKKAASSTEAVLSEDEGELKGDELEEGEITDEGEARPEETEPRPICRFYNRGQCTWGASCRFVHPGVTDKGNYTMFEMVRPLVPVNGPPPMYVPPVDPYRPIDRPIMGPPVYQQPPPRKEEPPVVETAWERGLRQAKEMLRKSSKRKETEVDFEEKKMNLSIGQDELDKENDYYARPSSPIMSEEPDRWGSKAEGEKRYRAAYDEYGADYYARYSEQVWHQRPHYDESMRGVYSSRSGGASKYPYPSRSSREKEYYSGSTSTSKRQKYSTQREVIVQRTEKSSWKDDTSPRPSRYAEPSKSTSGRADDWADPWMRAKTSPLSRKQRSRKQSYSSGSSYSSSSSSRSSRSSSSSYSRSRSRSRSSRSRSRSKPSKLSPPRRLLRVTSPLSRGPKVTISPALLPEKKPVIERSIMMNPPPPSPRTKPKPLATNPSPPNERIRPGMPARMLAHSKAASAVAAAMRSARSKSKSSRSSSNSDSSGSSSDSSESSFSSSSSSRPASPPVRQKRIVIDDRLVLAQAMKVKAMDALKLSGQKQQIKLTLKGTGPGDRPMPSSSLAGKKRPAESPPMDFSPPKQAGGKITPKKTAPSRREELLKQLKAVEDAIARKRSKIN